MNGLLILSLGGYLVPIGTTMVTPELGDLNQCGPFLVLILTTVIRQASDGLDGMPQQVLVCTGQHRQQRRKQVGVPETFTDHRLTGGKQKVARC